MRETNALLMQHIAHMTSATLEAKEKDDKRKTMFGRCSEEDEALFALLSARSWRDYDPKLPSFTNRLMNNRDINLALNRVQKDSYNWPGSVSAKQPC